MRARLSLVAAVALVGCVVLGADARGGDVPAGPPMRKKVDHPFVSAWLGDWVVTTKGGAGTARASVRLAIGDTAVVHDYASESDAGFAGHGVHRISDDGRTMTSWWFDSHGLEPMKMVGPLTETSAELNGTSSTGSLTVSWTRVEGGWDFTMSSGGRAILAQEYRRAPK
jgi:hypothetical protein